MNSCQAIFKTLFSDFQNIKTWLDWGPPVLLTLYPKVLLGWKKYLIKSKPACFVSKKVQQKNPISWTPRPLVWLTAHLLKAPAWELSMSLLGWWKTLYTIIVYVSWRDMYASSIGVGARITKSMIFLHFQQNLPRHTAEVEVGSCPHDKFLCITFARVFSRLWRQNWSSIIENFKKSAMAGRKSLKSNKKAIQWEDPKKS